MCAALTVAVRASCAFRPSSGYRLTCNRCDGSRIRSKNRNWLWLAFAKLALLLFCLALGAVPAVRAQFEDTAGRKIIRSQKPDYSAVLKGKGIGGKVRLRARVLANGTVAEVEVLGGNPVLAESAVKAVMIWKYAPAASPSNEIITFDFNPR